MAAVPGPSVPAGRCPASRTNPDHYAGSRGGRRPRKFQYLPLNGPKFVRTPASSRAGGENHHQNARALEHPQTTRIYRSEERPRWVFTEQTTGYWINACCLARERVNLQKIAHQSGEDRPLSLVARKEQLIWPRVPNSTSESPRNCKAVRKNGTDSLLTRERVGTSKHIHERNGGRRGGERSV